jgi:dUTP pyrophosphatase
MSREKSIEVKFKKLHKKAQAPTYAMVGDSGCDLYAVEDYSIKPMEVCLVRTGVSLEIPLGVEAQIRPRSGLTVKQKITIINSPATIDSAYRGEILVPLFNLSNKIAMILNGERFAQLVFAQVYKANFVEVEELSDSERGSGGFGHTG